MKIDWSKCWQITKNVLHILFIVVYIVFMVAMISYFVSCGSQVVVHDNGCDRIMKVYSQTGELLETYEGYIGILRMDGDTVVYDWEGSCVTIQGAIVTVQDAN